MKAGLPIKFLDLIAVNQAFEPELTETIVRISQSGKFVNGDQSERFEKLFADFIGTDHCISLGNGTNALELILKAYLILGRLKEQDEVLVPANTFFASFLAISNQGLVPVPVEPDPLTFNIRAASIEKKISKKTRALLLVHLYGRNAYSKNIRELVEKYQLTLIEDNAQAVGSNFNGVKSGALGDAAAHSFYPTKNLGAVGDAGAVTTNNPELADTIRALGNYGGKEKYIFEHLGTHSKMDEIQAGVLILKLKQLDKNNEYRNKIAKAYLKGIGQKNIILPGAPENNHQICHTWHLFTLLAKKREKLIHHLSDLGIETAIHYPVPPHLQPVYRKSNLGEFPITEKIHRETLSIPLNPSLAEKDVINIIESINAWNEI
jgi:dTDP-4-amino-4,6-dideoxygalactose transaminase